MEKQYWKRSFIVLSLLALIAGNAWGYVYGRAQVEVFSENSSGAVSGIGKVSINNQNFSESPLYVDFQNNSFLATSPYTKNYPVAASLVQQDGWFFYGWSKDKNTTSPTSTLLNTNLSFTGTALVSWERNTDTYYAIFKPVTVSGPSTLEVNPTELQKIYSGTIIFSTVGADKMADFTYGSANQTLSADGIWTFGEPVLKGNTVTVQYTYQAIRNTYKNSLGSRTDQATYTLTSKGDAAQSVTCTLTATFPAAQVTGVSQDVTANPTSIPFTTSGTITYNVAYVDDVKDFTCNTTKTDGDGSWMFVNHVLSEDKQKVSVAYTYNTGRSTYTNRSGNRTDKAAVTLTSRTDAASTKTCNLQVVYPEAAIGTPDVNNITLATPELSKTATVVFPVQYVDDANSLSATISPKTGAGTWQIGSCNYADGNATVTYSYKVDETNYTYNNTATLTLSTTSTDGTTVSKSADVAATCALSIYAADRGEYLTFLPTDTEGKSSVATFSTAYANTGTTFTATFVKQTGDGTWTKEAPQYSASATAPYGTVSVPFGFTPPANTPGDYSADLRLSSGTESFTVTLQATVEALSESDAEVIDGSGSTIGQGAWADMLLLANKTPNCTLRLLKDVNLNTLAVNQEIKRTMTLDLNGKTLSATLTSTYCRLLYLNTEGITLTVTDSRSGGAIVAIGDYANIMYAVQVNKGHLVLDKGHLEVKNSTTGNNDVRYAVAVYQAANTTFTMNGGELVAKKLTNRNAYGIYAEAGSTTNINGGVITTTAGSFAYGVRSYGNVTMTAGTINATTTATDYAYGIYMGASANADAAKCNYGTLNMTGGSINAETTTSTARGIYLEAGLAASDNAPDGTYSNKASAVGKISGVIINATAGTSTAYGIQVLGEYNSKTNEYFVTEISNAVINATAQVSNAYAVRLESAVNNTHGGMYRANAKLTNVTATATALTGSNAAGVYLVQAANIIKAGQAHTGEAFATAAKATIIGGKYTASVKQHYAFGISNAENYNCDITVSADGKAIAPKDTQLTIRDAEITAIHNGVNSATTADPTKSTDYHTAIGVNYAGAVDIDNCIIVADAKEVRFARGVMLGYGKSTIKNSTITASGKSSVYGIYVNAAIRNGNECIAELTSTNNTISATATSTTTSSVPYISADGAYGLYLHAVQTLATGTFAGDYAAAAKVVVYGDTYKAVSKRNTAIAIYSATRTTTLNGNAEAYPELIINGGTFTAEATNNNAYALQSGGNTIVDGGTFMATAEATQARGMYAVAGKLTATNATLKVTAGTGTAYGVCLDHNIQSYTLLNYAASAELNNLDVNVRTISGNTAEGIYLPATQKLQTEADHATFNSWEQYKGSDDNTEKNYYNTWNTYHQYYKEGALAIATSAVINGGTYTIIANGTTAYGVYASNTVVTTNGQASASVPLTIKNATFIAKTETGTTAYGIRTGGPTTIENSTITAEAATTTARGIYIMDKQTTITNSTIKAITQGRNSGNGNSDCYGIYADANVSNMGWLYRGELISNNNEVTATVPDGNNAYAVYLHAHNATVSTGTYAPMNATYATAAAAEINGGKFTATASGDPAGTPKTGQIAYAFHCAAPSSKNGATAAPVCTIDGGYFWGEAPSAGADISANALTDSLTICGDAYFLNAMNVPLYLCPEKSIQDLPSEMEAYKQGYRYYLGSATNPGINVCYIEETKTYYQTLVEALHDVNSTTKTRTIIMIADYTLPAGNYILPASATLLIPYYEGQNVAQGIVPAWKNKYAYPDNTPVDPSPFRKLTFDAGVNFTVCGTIEASSTLHISQNNWTGRVGGPYGWLHLNEGVRMDLESGAKLIAWGYVTGKGQIDAKDGSVVYEDFQMGDWRGGTFGANVQNNQNGVNKKGVFLITDYYCQNVECPVTFRPGAKDICHTGTFMETTQPIIGTIKIDGTTEKNPITLVGEGEGMFMMNKATAGNNTWVRKEYDPATDRLTWTLNSGATLGQMTFKIDAVRPFSINLNTADYVLPIATNFRVIANEGTISVHNDMCFLPGTEFLIRKEATVTVPSGYNVFFYDTANWASFGGYFHKLSYSPSWSKNPRPATNTQLPDAKLQIEGLLDIKGAVWTTAGGANICSTPENAGKVQFGAPAPASLTESSNKTLNQITAFDGETITYTKKAITSAKLTNADGAFTLTEGSSAGDVYTYMEDPADGVYRWISVRDNGCFTELKSSSTTQYIRPSDVVAVVANENGDHAYHNADATRYFINTAAKTTSADCMWWEAEPKGEIDGKVCYMANNPDFDNFGTYYYYDTNSDFWVAKTVTVTFRNYDGNELTNGDFGNIYNYNTRPQYFGATPARNPAGGYVYTWTGWDTELNHQGAAMIGRNEPFPPATANVTYYAHFEGTKKHYTVTFKNEDGYVIESGLWNEGDMPACSVTPQKAPTESEIYTFAYWSPTVTEVTRPAEYKAVYLSSLRPYTVTFANYDGTELHTEDFAYGTVPVYRGTTPVRESNTAYSYTFSGWDKPFEAVKGNITYTAQFTAKEREYGEVLDVVDWTADGIVLLNMNGYTSPSAKAGWIVTADGIDYSKTDRLPNRTLELSLQQDYAADDEVLILAKGTDGVVESRRRYKVPHVFDADAELGAVAADNSSVLFVRAGKLTVMGDATVAAVYVAPGAELCINAGVTLAAGKLVLRTEAFLSAVFTNNGTLLCDNVCYSRIVSDNSQAYPLALPFDADLSKVTFSNGKTASFGAHFGLLAFDTKQRADKGDLNGGNWVGVNPAETTKLNACQGYQLLSASGYWLEYRFPVTYTPDGTDAALPVKMAEGTAHKEHWGWNTFCSPYTSRFVCLPVSPEEAVKICLPNTDNRTYRQEVAATLEPASLFFHQAFADGTLSFGADAFAFVTAQPSVVARQMPAAVGSEQTQWIRLFCGNNTGMQDETTVYLHPDKFSMDYQTGYDVIKLSKQGTLPFVWSALPYGDMAFAALPDSVAERGIALAVFAPTADEMYFSLEENNWLMRLEHLWLLDKEEQIQTDLLENDYSWLASAGVSRGRFFLYPVVRNAPDNNTGWNELHTDDFVAYAMGKTIVVEHLTTGRVLRCYDTTGQLIACLNTDAEQLSIEVPTDGMYFVQVDNGVKKVMVK